MQARLLFVLLSLLILTACGTLSRQELEREPVTDYLPFAGEPIQRFSDLGGYDEWRPVGRNHVFIRTSARNAYLLTVAEPCFELQFANYLGLSSTGNTVSRLDSVYVRGQRCPITEIRPIDYRQMITARRAG